MDRFVLLAVIFSIIEMCLTSAIHWTMKQPMIELGEALLLNCEISNTIPQDQSRQWTTGIENHLLCFDNVTINSKKYAGRLNSPTEYSLTILNTTEDDLVHLYSCRAGFVFHQKRLEINDKNLIHKPEATTVKYMMMDGSYFLHVELSQIYPKPFCRVKLSDKHMNLTIVYEEKPRVLYKIIQEIKSESPLHDCGKTVEIECEIGRQKFNISQEHDLVCKDHQDTMKDKTSIIVTIGICVVAALLLLFTTVIYCLKMYFTQAIVKQYSIVSGVKV